MKHKLLFLLSAVIISAALSACSSGESSSQIETTAVETTAEETTKDSDAAQVDLSKLHGVKGNDKIAGSWKIKEGAGSQLSSFTYTFDGKGDCYMAIGNRGICSTYKFSVNDGEELFTAHLVFGIEGDYTYSFSEDGKTAKLNSVEALTSTVLEKVEDYNPIPAADKNAAVDKDLIGAWADENGEYLYFGEDGIMYQSQIGASFVFANYTAKNGSISQTYEMNETVNEKASYEVKGDTLIYNNYPYSKISAEELK